MTMSSTHDVPQRVFWLLLTPQNDFSRLLNPIFTVSGSQIRNPLGWMVLPGPTVNTRLRYFLLLAALLAYREATSASNV